MISIRGISKAYNGKKVFEDFSLDIYDGEFVVISGKSGSGKTTLLNIIGGIEKPDTGKVTVNGLDVTIKKERKRCWGEVIGFLFQNYVLIAEKSVTYNLEMIRKKNRSGRTIQQVLSETGLSGMEKRKVYSLSGGEQQRLALARILYKKTEVVLADEPTASLDRENADMLIAILKEISRNGKCVILVTHDDRIIEMGDRVIQI